MLPLNRLLSFIKQHDLFQPEERTLLAVSAGRDSVLMVHLFKKAGFNFGIAHCNFNLRADEADADEQFTKKLAEKLDVTFYSKRFDTKIYSQKHHISIQMAARELRYDWLEKIRREFDFKYIAFAHHQNDGIETMLLNLTRGTGIAGIHGILPKRNQIIRPLLFLNRDEIDELVKTENLDYRDDSSNQSSKYARNKIRLEVIPKLKELNPKLEETFEANRRRFAELEIILNQRIEELKQSLFKEISTNEIQIELSSLKKLNPLHTLLFGLFNPYGFTESVLHDLVNSWDGQAGKTFESPNYKLILDRDHIILTKRSEDEIEDVQINLEDTSIEWNNQVFKSYVSSLKDFQLQKCSNLVQLDFDLLKFPLKLRTWQKGDIFKPIGLKGNKKLSDFFIDQKIPLHKKHKIGVLENGSGEILWIVGYRMSDRFKISPNTKKVFIFEQQTAHGK
ncbi:MAG: tRNA lysidine(34) synthetase TilS [Daejeonella sp.]